MFTWRCRAKTYGPINYGTRPFTAGGFYFFQTQYHQLPIRRFPFCGCLPHRFLFCILLFCCTEPASHGCIPVDSFYRRPTFTIILFQQIYSARYLYHPTKCQSKQTCKEYSFTKQTLRCYFFATKFDFVATVLIRYVARFSRWI